MTIDFKMKKAEGRKTEYADGFVKLIMHYISPQSHFLIAAHIMLTFRDSHWTISTILDHQPESSMRDNLYSKWKHCTILLGLNS